MNTLTVNINIVASLARSEHHYARGKAISDDPYAPHGAGSPCGIDYVILPDETVQCSVGWSPHIENGVITHFYVDNDQTDGITLPVPVLNHHPTVLTRLPGGEPVRVDRDIAHILKMLWSQGVQTFTACQGGCPSEERSGLRRAAIGYYTRDEDTVQEFFGDFPHTEFTYGLYLVKNLEPFSDNTRYVRFPAPAPCPVCAP